MIKNWKNLFIKEEEPANTQASHDILSFPVSNQSVPVSGTAIHQQQVNDPVTAEVLQVYEKGLDSINMPGYDFYEFYKTVTSGGHPSEQTYQMAYQMAKTLDNTISASKLLSDAEFYISKINEVHSQYVTHGQQKLNTINEKKSSEKHKLQSDIEHASMRITALRAELQQLESDINQKRTTLLKVDDGYYPQEKSVREKLTANDLARKSSIDKLNMIREGILQFIKQ
jgi:chromosome segregation ATPase